MHVADDYMRPEHYEQTEESSGFRQEFETRKAKQVHKLVWNHILVWMKVMQVVRFSRMQTF